MKKATRSCDSVRRRCSSSARLKDEEDLLALLREPLGALDREHGLARARTAGHHHAALAAEAPKQSRLLVGEQDELLLLLEKFGRHRNLDAHPRSEHLTQDVGAVRTGRLAPVA